MSKIWLWCLCGSSLSFEWEGTAITKGKMGELLTVWYAGHSGNGHGDCNAATASKSRIRNEKRGMV